MNAKTWFVYISLFAVVSGCVNSPFRATELRTNYQDVELPEFVDDPAPQTNMEPAPTKTKISLLPELRYDQSDSQA